MKIADGKEFTYEEALAKKVLHKAIVEGNEAMIKLIWNYLDGMPAQSLDLTTGGDKINTAPPELREELEKMKQRLIDKI